MAVIASDVTGVYQDRSQALGTHASNRRLGKAYIRCGASLEAARFMNRVFYTGASGYLVASGAQVEAAAVEIDRVHEVLFVPKTSCRILHPLDLGIDRFAARVGDAVPQVRDDVLEPPFALKSDTASRFRSTPDRFAKRNGSGFTRRAC